MSLGLYEQAQGDRLSIAVGELLVVVFGKEKFRSVGGNVSERQIFPRELFGNESRSRCISGQEVGQFGSRFRWDRLSTGKVVEPSDNGFLRGRELRP